MASPRTAPTRLTSGDIVGSLPGIILILSFLIGIPLIIFGGNFGLDQYRGQRRSTRK